MSHNVIPTQMVIPNILILIMLIMWQKVFKKLLEILIIVGATFLRLALIATICLVLELEKCFFHLVGMICLAAACVCAWRWAHSAFSCFASFALYSSWDTFSLPMIPTYHILHNLGHLFKPCSLSSTLQWWLLDALDCFSNSTELLPFYTRLSGLEYLKAPFIIFLYQF